MYTNQIFQIFSATTCLLQRLSTTMASVLFQPAPAHASPHCLYRKGGAVVLSLQTRDQSILINPSFASGQRV